MTLSSAPPRTAATGGSSAKSSRFRQIRRSLRLSRQGMASWLQRPMADLHLLIAVFLLLLGVGLTMVLSSSSVAAYKASSKLSEGASASSFGVFKDQVLFAGFGLIVFLALMFTPTAWLKRLSLAGVIASILLLAAVLLVGREINGARSWLQLGPLSFQPSEVAKFAIVIWGGMVLASRRDVLGSFRRWFIPVVPMAGVIAGLLVLQPDIGTTAAFLVILLALLFFAGVSWWWFIGIGAAGVSGLLLYSIKSSVRADRLLVFLNPGSDPTGKGHQLTQSLYSLSDGGIFGVGLGQSRAKWSYLPMADSDFIFAIIGEELGLIGAVVVLCLYLALLWVGLRIARRNVDPFVKLVAATSTVWIVGQAMINIFYVIGLLPVTGLTLPMISTGGTSLIITMGVFGVLANFARREPQAMAALQAKGGSRVWQFFGIGAPGVSLRPVKVAAKAAKKNNRDWARTAARKAKEDAAQEKRSEKEAARQLNRRPSRAEVKEARRVMAERKAAGLSSSNRGRTTGRPDTGQRTGPRPAAGTADLAGQARVPRPHDRSGSGSAGRSAGRTARPTNGRSGRREPPTGRTGSR